MIKQSGPLHVYISNLFTDEAVDKSFIVEIIQWKELQMTILFFRQYPSFIATLIKDRQMF